MIKNLIKYGWGSFIVSCIIFYLCCISTGDDLPNPHLPNFDKVVHFFMYFGLTLVASVQYMYVKKSSIVISKLIIFALITPILYGGFIEIIQEYYFNRDGDWFDLLANAFGSITALGFSFWLRKRFPKLLNHE